MSWVSFFLWIGLYYFLSRALVIFYTALAEDDPTAWQIALEGNDRVLPVYLPIVGEFWFVMVICRIFLHHPLMSVGHMGSWLRSRRVERKTRKQETEKRKKEYLDNLSKYGLTPEDIPAYAKEPQALKEYLEAWQIVNEKK